jgi:putative ABC transport system permease protein
LSDNLRVETLRQDIAYAIRLLRRSPTFTAVAVATLTLGIAASTAIFAIVNTVLLRPLRFADPERLAMLQPSSGSRVSGRYLHNWRTQSTTLQDAAGWRDDRVTMTGRGEPLDVLADRVTSNFFTVLGTPALIGRTLTPGANLSDIPPEVVLSYRFWQQRLNATRDIVGQTLTLDGQGFTVIGVMPSTFTIRTNELPESRAEIWIPSRLDPSEGEGMGGMLNVVARLTPDATFQQTTAELNTIAERLETERPSFTRNWRVNVVPLLDATVRDVRATLLVLFGAVGILLLIACANIATLVLSRASARQGEIALRRALGASSNRLVGQLLTESVVLAAVAGVLGAVMAVWGTRLLVSFLPSGMDVPRLAEVGIDFRVLGFTLAATVATIVGCGLLPAVISARVAPSTALHDLSRGAVSSRSRNRVNALLVIAEVALAFVLLVGAGLLGRSFRELISVDPGFRPDHVITLRLTLPPTAYPSVDRVRTMGRVLLDATAGVQGVEAVGMANYLPLSNVGIGGVFQIAGHAQRPDEQPGSWVSIVGGRYFEAMRIPLLRGRLPDARDTERGSPVFVIDDTLARRYWPNADPVGAHVVFQQAGRAMPGEIIGVVGSVRWATVAADPVPSTYFWFPQSPDREITLVARIAGDPRDAAATLRDRIRQIDPNQPVAEVRVLRDFVSADLERPRITTLVLVTFAASALLLAALGLYGVISFGVTQRTHEIGVRVALGARSADVLRLIMGRGLIVLGAGLAIGMAAGFAAGGILSGLLYGVTSRDPTTLVASAVFLLAVGMCATYIPARRATAIDPMDALRSS